MNCDTNSVNHGSRSLINNDCMTTFSTFLGLKVCADVKVPQASLSAPFVLLNGPAVMSLSVEKSESSMEGYYLKVEKDAKGRLYQKILTISCKLTCSTIS